LPGVRIGHHATVGAGSVVTKDVMPYSVVVGCPAREREREVV
jgi:acetyltransferase-like isoleucine patch superfamily enzyme